MPTQGTHTGDVWVLSVDIFVLSDRSEDDPMCGRHESSTPRQSFEVRHSMTEEVYAMEWTDVSESEHSEKDVGYYDGVALFQSTSAASSQCSTDAMLRSPRAVTTVGQRRGRRGESKTVAAGVRMSPMREVPAGPSRSPSMVCFLAERELTQDKQTYS